MKAPAALKRRASIVPRIRLNHIPTLTLKFVTAETKRNEPANPARSERYVEIRPVIPKAPVSESPSLLFFESK